MNRLASAHVTTRRWAFFANARWRFDETKHPLDDPDRMFDSGPDL
jgi:hypothetical protein